MAEITLEGIAKVIQAELKESLDPIKTELSEVHKIVDNHTGALFELSKDVKELKEEMIVSNRRAGKHEEAIKFTAEKVGISEPIKKILEA